MRMGNVKYGKIKHRGILESIVRLFAFGKTDYSDIEPFRNDTFFRDSLDLNGVPSESALHQRCDKLWLINIFKIWETLSMVQSFWTITCKLLLNNKLIFLSVAIATTTTVSAVELVKESKPVAKIYLESLDKENTLPRGRRFNKLSLPQQQERLLAIAVRDLNYHLKKMSGAKLEVVITSDPKKIETPAIVIGTLANRLGAKPSLKSELGESYRLKINKRMLLIGGESPVGTAYGIYELLSRLGCDWVMPGPNGEVIPKRSTITIPDLEVEQSPSFAVRSPWYFGGRHVMSQRNREEFDQWKLRHKQQINRAWHPLMVKSGHIWGALIKRYKKQFEENPEMLALVRQPDGTMIRKGPQLETTSPEVLNLFVEYIRNMYKKNKWAKDKTVCIGVGPFGGGGHSQSPESIIAGSGRTDPMSGEPDIIDLQVLLANQIIKKLEKEFPNFYLGFYLCNAHADYPMRYTPDKRVLIVIVDNAYSRFHGLNDSNSKTRSYYKSILKQWGKLHRKQDNPIFFRGYNWNLAENFLPYTKLKIWGEDIPYYKKLGVIGFYNEYSKAWAVLGASDYLEAELTWNVNQKWRQVLKRYCKNAFGKGASLVEKYYLMLVDRQCKSGQEAGSYHSFALIYDQDFLEKSFSLFEQAEKLAGQAAEKQRVSFARIPVEMLKHYLDFRKAYCSFNFVAAKQKFKFMKSELERYEKIDANLICRSGVRYLNHFFGKFIEESVKYSTGKYKIVYRLPDRMKTAFDSNTKGQDMGFARPGINDRDYITSATYSSTWDAQGLIGYRFGSVWYRTRFTLPVALKKRALGLFVGGVDSIVRVWCNGKYIGMGRGFAKPFAFDLTGLTRPGENLIAIQVQRFGNSEVGTGGLIYPAFVFTGPRLEQRAPKLEKLARILPEGERK
jgi:uncharacterized protein DUF4838/glycosyl hydrolase family 2